jgi:hypothetical protein|tara:strand:- start:448 stop:639 length:192 start_codon:yes stop_codon:yes gene_type:complete
MQNPTLKILLSTLLTISISFASWWDDHGDPDLYNEPFSIVKYLGGLIILYIIYKVFFDDFSNN